MRKTLVMAMAVVLIAAGYLIAAEQFTVENGSSGKNPAACGGWWYTYSDASSGGNSQVTPASDKFEFAKAGKAFAARMEGKAGNKLGWDFVGMGVTFGEKCGCPGEAAPVDLSKYTTLVLKVKGSITGGRIVVNLPYSESKCDKDNPATKSLTDWADYEFALNKSLGKDWTIVKIDLRKDFKQPKWAKKTVSIEEVLKNAHNLNFHFSSPDGDIVDFYVSEIAFE